MPARCEMVVDGGMDRKKTLGGPGRSKPLHRPFSSSDPHMRSFDPVILPLRLVMPGVETQITKRCRVGSPFVGDDSSRCETMLLQELAHQLERGTLVPPRLDEDIKHLAFLIDGTPQIHPATADRDVHFVQMPLWMCPSAPASQTSCDLWAKPDYPTSDGFVGDLDSPFSQQFLDVAKAQVETGIKPNCVLDNRRWEVKVSIADRAHSVSLTRSAAPAHPSL